MVRVAKLWYISQVFQKSWLEDYWKNIWKMLWNFASLLAGLMWPVNGEFQATV
jgi:hypothetical protein